MVLSAKALCKEIRLGSGCDPLAITVVPTPDLGKIEQSAEASISLRLGRWFLALRQSSETHISFDPLDIERRNKAPSKSFFVPFGETFVLHPNRFVLGCTLEWVRVPATRSAVVVGKSTLGRRGIIIETAAGVHPGFSGCLTLEIANVGEVPVELVAGMMICQLFFHPIHGEAAETATPLSGQRKPRLGVVREDLLLTRLAKSRRLASP